MAFFVLHAQVLADQNTEQEELVQKLAMDLLLNLKICKIIIKI